METYIRKEFKAVITFIMFRLLVPFKGFQIFKFSIAGSAWINMFLRCWSVTRFRARWFIRGYWQLFRCGAISHCAFSSNLFHGHLAQIYIDQLSDPENKKCSPWKVFGKNHPQTPWLLSRRSPRCLEARLSQHYVSSKMRFSCF